MEKTFGVPTHTTISDKDYQRILASFQFGQKAVR